MHVMFIPLTILGLAAGVLVNRLGTDLPARRRISQPHCPYCGKTRPLWQWVTLPSFLIWNARCPYCDAPIRLREPLVEVGLVVAYNYVWIAFGSSIQAFLYAVYTTIFALVIVTDIERRLILNVVTYPAILFGFGASFINPEMRWDYSLLGGLVGFGFFLVAMIIGERVFGSGALGMGDVKLALFIGLIVGFPLVIEMLVITILVGAAVSSFLLLTGVCGLHDHLPYGPFLVVGALVTLFWGYHIMEWFLY